MGLSFWPTCYLHIGYLVRERKKETIFESNEQENRAKAKGMKLGCLHNVERAMKPGGTNRKVVSLIYPKMLTGSEKPCEMLLWGKPPNMRLLLC